MWRLCRWRSYCQWRRSKSKKIRIIKGRISILIPIPPNDDKKTEAVVSFDILEVLEVNHFWLRLILFSVRSSHPRIFTQAHSVLNEKFSPQDFWLRLILFSVRSSHPRIFYSGSFSSMDCGNDERNRFLLLRRLCYLKPVSAERFYLMISNVFQSSKC